MVVPRHSPSHAAVVLHHHLVPGFRHGLRDSAKMPCEQTIARRRHHPLIDHPWYQGERGGCAGQSVAGHRSTTTPTYVLNHRPPHHHQYGGQQCKQGRTVGQQGQRRSHPCPDPVQSWALHGCLGYQQAGGSHHQGCTQQFWPDVGAVEQHRARCRRGQYRRTGDPRHHPQAA